MSFSIMTLSLIVKSTTTKTYRDHYAISHNDTHMTTNVKTTLSKMTLSITITNATLG